MSSTISTEDFPDPTADIGPAGGAVAGDAVQRGFVQRGSGQDDDFVPGPPVASVSAAALAASEPDAWDGQRTAIPWYGLDEAWGGDRWLGSIMHGPDGVAEYGTLGHGDHPARRPDDLSPRRFCGVVTMARLGRRSGGGATVLEPTTLSTLAAVAGLGLLSDAWPWAVDKALRGDWLHQQTELAYEVAENLDDAPWRAVQLPVDGKPTRFRYRESEYGWVLAAELRECWLGAYGRGVTAYGLGFEQVTLDAWDGYEALPR
ncbi:hypothetical protein KGQ20_10310 [Catenulispora sp. NF23]|uniref:Uncharacterized protein n=1 Tax=Catenulispora pinistramenti TaxID=2705254 RepID=A0ABS5KHG8_9ACTN|nr:hypothetical protein [Catenulispora pinistramenti]MBS2533167.1 hypothetical protein [Catenulispora pinistramenti]MBS2545791.1 hypothetical protein [Catenulispora pinistramenti]